MGIFGGPIIQPVTSYKSKDPTALAHCRHLARDSRHLLYIHKMNGINGLCLFSAVRFIRCLLSTYYEPGPRSAGLCDSLIGSQSRRKLKGARVSPGCSEPRRARTSQIPCAPCTFFLSPLAAVFFKNYLNTSLR